MIKQTYRKQFLLLSVLFSVLFLFQACTNDGDDVPQPPSENKYLTGVITERRFTKAEVIAVLNSFSPGMDLGSTPLALLIGDVDVAAITYTTTGVDGKLTVASGIVALPAGTTAYETLLSILICIWPPPAPLVPI